MTNIKKISIAVVVFLLTYVIFLIVLAPADKIIGQFKLPRGVAIGQISGSIWSGKAEQVIIDNYAINKVRWDVNLTSLLMFNPSVDVTFGNRYAKGPQGHATLQNLTGQPKVVDADVNIDANEVLPYLPLPIDMTAQGKVQLTAAEFAMGKPVCEQLNGDIKWQNAQINAMDEQIDLGAFKANLGCENGAVTVDVLKDNRLGLEFTAYIAKPGRISGQGYITPGSEFPEQIKPVLSFIGKPDKQGRYRIKI